MLATLSSRRTALALTLAAACWGIGTVISKRAIDEIPPLTLLPIQLAASLAVLAVLMRWRRLPFRDRSASPVLGPLGVLNPGLAYALSLLGLAFITASLSVMLWAIEPLLILFLAGWFLHERVTRSLVVLSLVALAGMLLVIYQPGSTGTAIGVVLTVAGVACCATYTVITRRWLATADSTAQVIVAQQAHALAFAFVLVTAAWLVGGAVRPDHVSVAGWASAIGSGILYYGLAYWLYLSGLRQVPASVAAVSFYLIPIFGVAGGFLFLGERLDPSQWVGVGIVLVAVYAILRRTSGSGLDPEEAGLAQVVGRR
jgi:drug/metabolite transporter (DMT)-like permease